LRREKECNAANERAKALLKMRLAKTEGSSLQALVLLADKLSLDKEYKDALKLLERAEVVAGQQHGEKSLKVGEVLHSKAAVYFNIQDWSAAEDCYVQEIAIMEAHLAEGSLELALPLRMLAAARLKQGDKPMFESLRDRARAIEQRHGMEDYALVVMKREFESLKSRVGVDHPSVTDKHREMALIQQQHGDDESAARNLEAYTHRRGREYTPNGTEFLKDLISSVLTIQINTGKKEEAVKILATATETMQSEKMKMDLLATFFLLQAQLMTEEWPPALDTARTLPALCTPKEKARVIEIIKETMIKNASSLEEYGHQAAADEIREIAQAMHSSDS
jgi:tetratricopeptide (TPR) repeat protein